MANGCGECRDGNKKFCRPHCRSFESKAYQSKHSEDPEANEIFLAMCEDEVKLGKAAM